MDRLALVPLRADFTVDGNGGGPDKVTTSGADRKIEQCSGAWVDFPPALGPERITMTESFQRPALPG